MFFGKFTRPEFWPAWLFYLPLVPYAVFLTIRYRGFGTICAADPGIPLGGLVGESKSGILRNVSSPHVLKFRKILRGEDGRVSLKGAIDDFALEYPYILKPDAGQRGAGVKLIKNAGEADLYLSRTNADLLVQEYHPGPKEAGVFYYRMPGQSKGNILSITRKTFPVIEGDGLHTLGELVLSHPRFKYQWTVFRERRKDWDRIPELGERIRLAEAGNHCQGTLFTDGADLITETLTAKIDEISRTFDGFYFGRYDIRYRSDESFKEGKNFGIVELNGITSESTNLYDPEFGIFRKYSVLFGQWNLLFRIGWENRKRGIEKTSLYEIAKTLLEYYSTDKKIDDRSD